MNSPSVSIVVLNWNGLTDTRTCVQSLRPFRYAKAQDCRRRQRFDRRLGRSLADRGIRSWHRPARSDRNLGYAGGNNLGIRYALDHGADFILVLNNDTTVDPMLLDELLGAASRFPEAGCFGPWIFYMHDPERLWCTRSEWASADSGLSRPPEKGSLPPSCHSPRQAPSTSAERPCFSAPTSPSTIGLFDERFFLVYEDSDWCYRARRAGFECMTVPSARVWHKVGTSFGSEDSPLRTYFSMRNKLLWAEKNATRSELFRMLRGALRRLLPGVGLDRRAGIPAHKALLWAGTGFAREWSRKLHDPQEVAHRQAVLDYVFRRFGDCPPKIRALAQAWAAARSAMTPGGGGS